MNRKEVRTYKDYLRWLDEQDIAISIEPWDNTDLLWSINRKGTLGKIVWPLAENNNGKKNR